MECQDDVDGSGTVPHSEQWISIDNAFKPSLSGLEALKRVQLAIVWHWDRRSDFDEQLRLARPFLSVLQPKVARFNHGNPEQDSDPE
jgi:tRNA (Thr-GGU) A37 N-methylase